MSGSPHTPRAQSSPHHQATPVYDDVDMVFVYPEDEDEPSNTTEATFPHDQEDEDFVIVPRGSQTPTTTAPARPNTPVSRSPPESGSDADVTPSPGTPESRNTPQPRDRTFPAHVLPRDPNSAMSDYEESDDGEFGCGDSTGDDQPRRRSGVRHLQRYGGASSEDEGDDSDGEADGRVGGERRARGREASGGAGGRENNVDIAGGGQSVGAGCAC